MRRPRRTDLSGDLKSAFVAAVRSLAPEERAVVRSSAVDELNIDQIGALYRVHRATAARWVRHARWKLASSLRRELVTRTGLEKQQCESVVALLQSRVDLSLDRVLRESASDLKD